VRVWFSRAFRDRFETCIDPNRDSLRFYFLESDVRVEHHGAVKPLDMDGALVV
jgi:hypothetical protein